MRSPVVRSSSGVSRGASGKLRSTSSASLSRPPSFTHKVRYHALPPGGVAPVCHGRLRKNALSVLLLDKPGADFSPAFHMDRVGEVCLGLQPHGAAHCTRDMTAGQWGVDRAAHISAVQCNGMVVVTLQPLPSQAPPYVLENRTPWPLAVLQAPCLTPGPLNPPETDPLVLPPRTTIGYVLQDPTGPAQLAVTVGATVFDVALELSSAGSTHTAKVLVLSPSGLGLVMRPCEPLGLGQGVTPSFFYSATGLWPDFACVRTSCRPGAAKHCQFCTERCRLVSVHTLTLEPTSINKTQVTHKTWHWSHPRPLGPSCPPGESRRRPFLRPVGQPSTLLALVGYIAGSTPD